MDYSNHVKELSASDIVLAEGILTTTKGEVIPLEKIKDIDALMNSAKSISLDNISVEGDRSPKGRQHLCYVPGQRLVVSGDGSSCG